MGFEIYVAKRYLLGQRKGLFAWVTTLIGVLGVAVGVAALITTLSVMNGFQKDIRAKIVGAQAHVVVYGARDPEDSKELARKLGSDKDVVATAPFAFGQAILHTRGRSTGVVVKGIVPEEEFQTNELKKALEEGSWEGLKSSGNVPGLVIGEELARNAGVWVGQQLLLISTEGGDSAIALLPRMKAYRVAGIFKTGYYEYDSSMAYMELPEAKAFFGTDASFGVQLRLKSMDLAKPAAERFKKQLGFGHVVRTFEDLNRTLFGALKLEKFVMFTILALIVLVAALNIASNLILLTTEKVRDIGLLKAMGASPAVIRGIFWWEGLMIGLVGVTLGVGLGLLLSWIIGTFPIVELPADIYYLSRVPVAIEPWDVAIITVSSVILCLLATVYPAFRAAKVNPVEAIHYG